MGDAEQMSHWSVTSSVVGEAEGTEEGVPDGSVVGEAEGAKEGAARRGVDWWERGTDVALVCHK